MIGIFDSGVGGLTVAKALLDTLKGYDILYFGDTARTPYGSKSPKTILSYSIENTEFLLKNGAKIIVIACNTASSIATEEIKKRYKDIPVFEVIKPAVNLAYAYSKNKKIGVIGTKTTVKSNIYEEKLKAIDDNMKIYSKACPLLVPLIEEGWISKPETKMIVKKYLLYLKVRQIDTLILGCTHYPLLKSIIQAKIGKRVKLIDSSVALAGSVKKFLDKNPNFDLKLSKKGKVKLFVSDISDAFEKLASSILKQGKLKCELFSN